MLALFNFCNIHLILTNAKFRLMILSIQRQTSVACVIESYIGQWTGNEPQSSFCFMPMVRLGIQLGKVPNSYVRTSGHIGM